MTKTVIVNNLTNITKTNNHIKQLKTTALRLVAVNPVSGMGEVQHLDAYNNSGRVGFISPLGSCLFNRTATSPLGMQHCRVRTTLIWLRVNIM